MTPSKGSLGIMRAATDRTLKNGEYVGPTKIGGFRGLPKLLTSSEKSYTEKDAQKLWEMSEQLTGVKYLISPMVSKLFYPHDRAAATS
jgi:hypothetical protein